MQSRITSHVLRRRKKEDRRKKEEGRRKKTEGRRRKEGEECL
ncbi:MAG: hypothetical protein ACRC62_03440 [Microcoleus sp.]